MEAECHLVLARGRTHSFWQYKVDGTVVRIRTGNWATRGVQTVEMLPTGKAALAFAKQRAAEMRAEGFRPGPKNPVGYLERVSVAQPPPVAPRLRKRAVRVREARPAHDLDALDRARAARDESVRQGGGDRGDLEHYALENRVEHAWKKLGRAKNRALGPQVRQRFLAARAGEEQLPDRYAEALAGIYGVDALPDLFEAAAKRPSRVPLVTSTLLADLVARHPTRARTFLTRQANAKGRRGSLARRALTWVA